jgi:hypothetical protein
VLDEQGQPIKNIAVHAVLERNGMYMPTADSDESGQFVIEGLEPGTYDVFGESDAAGYPNTAISFYSTKEPTRVVLGSDSPAARIVLNLGPRAGVLSGTVIDKVTGKAIVSRHALHFIVKKASNPEDSILFGGPAKFRWLIPAAVEIILEVTAGGYKPWFYADASNPSRPLPLRLESGEQKSLDIELERDARQSTKEH